MRRPPDRDDGGYSEAELAELRRELDRARRVQSRNRILLGVAIGLVLLCLLVILLVVGRVVPREAVGAVGGTAVITGAIAALSLRVLGSWVRTDALIVAARAQFVATAESLTGFVDERAEHLARKEAQKERGEASGQSG